MIEERVLKLESEVRELKQRLASAFAPRQAETVDDKKSDDKKSEGK